ncbi:NAD(P)/FAD-dependent oxidoreductase [Microvirga alba]|nr:FAD-binding oxidoreductase [Microvirga alba]
MTEKADVVVIGGGFMGAASAFFLRQRARSVILLERGLIGQQASGVNFGNVRRQGRYLPQLPLANRSRAIWSRLTELIGTDCEFLATGHLRICYRREDVGELEAYATHAREYGLDLELLTQRALIARYPYLGPEIVAASLSPQDGHANPRLAAPAFGRAARSAGAQIHENTEVVGVTRSGEDFLIESADGRRFSAPTLLITAGAWATQLSAQLGETAPLVVRGPQMGVTEPVPYRVEPVVGVMTNDPREVIYLRQVTRGNIVFGGGGRGPADATARRAYVLPGNILNQFRQLGRLVPDIRRLNLIRVWSGIESYLPDDCPIMGESPTVPGLYYAFGFCGHGFQLGPGVGETMAELIDTGTTEIDLAPYRIERFAEAAPIALPEVELSE